MEESKLKNEMYPLLENIQRKLQEFDKNIKTPINYFYYYFLVPRMENSPKWESDTACAEILALFNSRSELLEKHADFLDINKNPLLAEIASKVETNRSIGIIRPTEITLLAYIAKTQESFWRLSIGTRKEKKAFEDSKTEYSPLKSDVYLFICKHQLNFTLKLIEQNKAHISHRIQNLIQNT
jgi:hypothetical protein